MERTRISCSIALPAICVALLALTSCNKREAADAAKTQAPEQAAGSAQTQQQNPQGTDEKTTLLATESVATLPANVLSTASTTASPCSFDTIDGAAITDTATIDRKQRHVLRGWLANETVTGGVPEFRIVLKGAQSYAVSVASPVARPDVADFFKKKELEQSGFNVSVPMDAVAAGEYETGFLFSSNGKALYCNGNKRIVLRD